MKILFIFLFSIFNFSYAFGQVNTERTKVFFKTLKNIGVAPVACDKKVGPSITPAAPADFKAVRLTVSSNRMETFEGVKVSVLTKEEAQKLFDSFRELSYIPSKYLEDGCYARAHELALIAKNNGITLGKAFLLPTVTAIFFILKIYRPMIQADLLRVLMAGNIMRMLLF